ncbi:MAG: arginine--tRNA ligase [Lentisphaeria bacterium]|nr:arginine--tRNA ligase [Lentisphaeria bacterium]NQZ68873.1 arginine--tRNA ligase [Lentisphaeria bacterium]
MMYKFINDLRGFWLETKSVEDFELTAELCPENDSPDSAISGHLTINCFRLAKALKGNPMQLAQEANDYLSKHEDIASTELIKAFVNVTLKPEALFRDTVADSHALLTSVKLSDSVLRKVLIEYSAPNTNKPLHLGHIRNNSLGMSLAAILKRVGHKVNPVNLVNDRGIHICRSMLAYQLYGEGKTPESNTTKGDHFVGEYYIKFATELKKQLAELREQKPELAEEKDEAITQQTEIGKTASDMLLKWEENDPDIRQLWELMNGWVMDGFTQTYNRMGIEFDKIYFESETYSLGKDIVQSGLQTNVFYKRDDNATEIDLKSYKLDKKVVLRSDGTSVYITQDIGTTLLKYEEFNPDSMIWVVGDEQIYHFKVLFAILKELGYDWADDLFHLAYGMVNLPPVDGKISRMKSREGTVVDADDLFDEMKQLSKDAILERLDDAPEDIDTRAEVIGMGAIKFMLLKVNPKTTMIFDPTAAVKFEGDTGAYLQYSYARIASIKRNAEDKEMADTADWSLLTHQKEARVALMCSQYPAIMQKAANDYDTACLCNYLLDLAKAFNSFYHDCPILKEEVDPELSKTRFELSNTVQMILKDGLTALTIDTLEAM